MVVLGREGRDKETVLLREGHLPYFIKDTYEIKILYGGVEKRHGVE